MPLDPEMLVVDHIFCINILTHVNSVFRISSQTYENFQMQIELIASEQPLIWIFLSLFQIMHLDCEYQS